MGSVVEVPERSALEEHMPPAGASAVPLRLLAARTGTAVLTNAPSGPREVFGTVFSLAA